MNLRIYKSVPYAQQGAALITALVLLVILTMLGLSSMRTNVMEERMAANSQEIIRAFQAAESGLESAFGNSDAFNISHTIDNPLTVNDIDFGGLEINVSYESVFRQMTPPKRGSGWDSGFAFYHFNMSSDAETVSGARSRMNAGAYQVGRR